VIRIGLANKTEAQMVSGIEKGLYNKSIKKAVALFIYLFSLAPAPIVSSVCGL